MRVVFLGSGAFAIPSFEALLDAGHEVVALVTQPDRAKGRGQAAAPPPLKPVAQARGVPLLQPPRIREPSVQETLRAFAPEIQVVVAYGQILPGSVIRIPPRGTVNVHASLLPRYRGAAPIQWAIARGETQTGVTTMLIDEGLDTGPLLLSAPLAIGEEETAAELEPRLARLGAELLLATIRGLESNTLSPVPQDDSQATLAPLLRKQDGVIDWSLPAPTLARYVRAFQPWPGTTTRFRGQPLKLLRARPEQGGSDSSEPGTLVGLDRQGIVVACAPGTRLRLQELHPESRRPMAAAAFAAGVHPTLGERLG